MHRWNPNHRFGPNMIEAGTHPKCRMVHAIRAAPEIAAPAVHGAHQRVYGLELSDQRRLAGGVPTRDGTPLKVEHQKAAGSVH